MKAANFTNVFPKICRDWSVVMNYSYHPGGRIWSAWIPALFVVDIRLFGDQVIHCEVLHKSSGKYFWVTLVYGLNDGNERARLWAKLYQIGSQLSGAWIIIGDFNNVMNLKDRYGYGVTLTEVDGLRQCVRECKILNTTQVGHSSLGLISKKVKIVFSQKLTEFL